MVGEHKTPPVLLLAFNRPDTTAKVIDAIRPARPGRLYFSVDGPRDDRPGELGAVRAVRDLANRVDWPCEVVTLFNERNLGCKTAVSRAVTRFFEQEEAGIILEDDCVAHPSFFGFAATLLDRFKDDERVFMISGDNFQFGRRRDHYSYYFSHHTHIWGWATWRRAWARYDHSMKLWPEIRDGGWLEDVVGDRRGAEYWRRIFEDTYAERNTSWAYRWTFAAWVNGGLAVLPNANLVSNIGFGDAATHTVNRRNRLAGMPLSPMEFPLRHPPFVIRNARADSFTQRTIFANQPLWKRMAKRLYRTVRPQ